MDQAADQINSRGFGSMTKLSQPRIVCALVLIVMLSGCYDPYDSSGKNDRRISEYHKCLDAGMKPYMNLVAEVVCSVPDENQ